MMQLNRLETSLQHEIEFFENMAKTADPYFKEFCLGKVAGLKSALVQLSFVITDIKKKDEEKVEKMFKEWGDKQ